MKKTKATPAGYSGNNNQAGAPPPGVTEQKGNLLINDLWQNGTDIINDMRVMNTDSKSHLGKQPEKCLHEVGRVNKRMYLEAYLQQCRHFYPFVTLVDGLMCVEATSTLKRIVSSLATKFHKLYLKTYGYVKSRTAVTLLRSMHWYIRGIQG